MAALWPVGMAVVVVSTLLVVVAVVVVSTLLVVVAVMMVVGPCCVFVRVMGRLPLKM